MVMICQISYVYLTCRNSVTLSEHLCFTALAWCHIVWIWTNERKMNSCNQEKAGLKSGTISEAKQRTVSLIYSWGPMIFNPLLKKDCNAEGYFEPFWHKCHLNSSWWQTTFCLWAENPHRLFHTVTLTLVFPAYSAPISMPITLQR